MTRSEFSKYRNEFVAIMASKSIAEIRAFRRCLAIIMQLDVEEVIILIQELALIENRKTKEGRGNDEFNQIMERNFPDANS